MTSKNKKYYKARADRLFSLWIRQKDAVGGVCRCITCGTPHSWRTVHCGHFMSRRHEATRYHEQNAHAQCVACNTFDQGKQYEHGRAINEKYSEVSMFDKNRMTADKLNILSKMSCKRGWIDYKIIGDELLEKLKKNNFDIR